MFASVVDWVRGHRHTTLILTLIAIFTVLAVGYMFARPSYLVEDVAETDSESEAEAEAEPFVGYSEDDDEDSEAAYVDDDSEEDDDEDEIMF